MRDGGPETWKAVVFLLILAGLVFSPALSAFPLENQYVWCFAKRTLPVHLRNDLQAAGVSSPNEKLPPTELRISCSPSRGESFRECQRLSSQLFDISANWRSATVYSRANNLWEGFSSASLAEAAAMKYGYALSFAGELESLILSEIESSGIWKLSGELGESGGYTALSLYAGVSEDVASRKFRREISDNDLFLSQIRGYYAKFLEFSRENHAGYLFSKNCSQYSDWSVFECSTSSWAVVNIACAGNFSTCVFATDCEATISHNVSLIAANLPSFSVYWERNPGTSILDAAGKYQAHAELSLRAATLEKTLLSEIDSLSREISAKTGELRRAEVQKIPFGLVFSEISSGPSAQAYYRTDFLNFSLATLSADREVSRAAGTAAGLAGLPAVFDRVATLKQAKSSLEDQLAALILVEEIAGRIERRLDELVPQEVSVSTSGLPVGRRILLKSVFQGVLAYDEGALREVACAPTIRSFPQHALGTLPRTGEGLYCPSEMSPAEILSALDAKYSEQVNRKRGELILRADISPNSLAEFERYEFLPRGGWISAENAWGFLSFLDRLYSEILQNSTLAPRAEFEEILISPAFANRNSFSRVYGTISGPAESGTVEISPLKFSGNFPAEISWAEGGTVRLVPGSSGKLVLEFRKEASASTVAFLAERNLGLVANSAETFSGESASSESYTVSKKYSVSCPASPGYSGEFLIGTGVILPESGLSVSGAKYAVIDGQVFLQGACLPAGAPVEANISYARPISVELSEIPSGFLVSATNALTFRLPKASVKVPLPPNSTEISVDGKTAFQLSDGTVGIETSFSAGERKTFEVGFVAGPEFPLPECAFCCNLAGRTLTKAELADANYALPQLVGEYQKLSESERVQVSALACQDRFSDALALAKKFSSERDKLEKQACSKISSSAVSDRRILSVMKDLAGKISLLRKKYPWAPFENPPELAGISIGISEAEKDCNETLLAEAEAGIADAKTGIDSALASAALWASGEFGNGSFSPELSLAPEAVRAVDARIGNRTRLALSSINPLLLEPPEESGYGRYLDLVLSSKELIPIQQVQESAIAAIAAAERMSPESASEAGQYLQTARSSLSKGMVLEGLYAGHYSAILSENAGKTSSGNSRTLLKILAAAISLSLAAAVILIGNKRRGGKTGKKGKDSGDAGIFGEIR